MFEKIRPSKIVDLNVQAEHQENDTLSDREMTYASPTLTPAITDLPYMVISRLRATAHCPKCGHGLIYSVNKL